VHYNITVRRGVGVAVTLFVPPAHIQWVTGIILIMLRNFNGEPGNSVSIVSGYEKDGWAIEVRSPAEAKGFFL
jgi:hypothetical protein